MQTIVQIEEEIGGRNALHLDHNSSIPFNGFSSRSACKRVHSSMEKGGKIDAHRNKASPRFTLAGHQDLRLGNSTASIHIRKFYNTNNDVLLNLVFIGEKYQTVKISRMSETPTLNHDGLTGTAGLIVLALCYGC